MDEPPLDAPLISIPEAQPDTIVDRIDNADGVQVLVSLPNGAVAGDQIEVTVVKPNGDSISVESTVPLHWDGISSVEITVPVVEQGDYLATATVANSAVSNTVPFILDTSLIEIIDAPVLSSLEINENQYVNADSAADGVQIDVLLPDGIEAGDTLTLYVTEPTGQGVTLTSLVPSDYDGSGPIQVTIPAFVEGPYALTGTVTNGNGNTSLAANSLDFILDLTAPGEETGTDNGGPDTINKPEITIPDADDGVVDETELADGVDVEVTLPESTQPGDTITVTVTDPNGDETEIEGDSP